MPPRRPLRRLRRALVGTLATGLSCALMSAVGVSGVAVAAPPTQDTVKPAATGPVNPPYTPKTGVVFNNPKSKSKAKVNKIVTVVDRAIDATPKGATITMAQFLYDRKSTTTKLIAAKKRGVNVQFLLDDGEKGKYITKVKKALGTNKKAKSFFATCHHSCMSNGTSVMHAKLYLFSQSGSAANVSMVASGNLHRVNIEDSWNNIETIANNKAVYDSLRLYFTDMLKDKTTPNYYRTTTAGIYKLYYFPRAGLTKSVIKEGLSQVKCTGVPKGYGGSGGRTLIRVAMWGWSVKRQDVAKQLWSLQNQGCKVEVILNRGRTSRKPIFGALLKGTKKYGKIKVYDAWRDRNHNDYAELYIHHKVVMINGLVAGKPTRVVYTGSQNFTGPATISNNDIVLRIESAAIYRAYNANLDYIRGHWTKRIYHVPPKLWVKSKAHGDSVTAGATEPEDGLIASDEANGE